MLKCHWHFNGICVKLSGLTINWNRSHILLTDDLSPPPSCSFYPSVCCICIGNELKQNSYLTDRSPPWWTFYLSGLHSDDALIMSNKWGTQVLYILCSMLMGCNAEGSNQQSFPAKKIRLIPGRKFFGMSISSISSTHRKSLFPWTWYPVWKGKMSGHMCQSYFQNILSIPFTNSSQDNT